MCKSSGFLAIGRNFETKKAVILKPHCESWACEDCATMMINRHLARIIHATYVLRTAWSFMTITAHENWRGEASLKNLSQGWTKLTERMRRKYGTRHYVLIHELHADGMSFHIHMLYNGIVSKKWLKDACKGCGIGYIADSQKLRDSHSAGKYVTKYITKSLTETRLPKRFKRVRYSVGFPKIEYESESDYQQWSTETATPDNYKRLRRYFELIGFTLVSKVNSNDLTYIDSSVNVDE